VFNFNKKFVFTSSFEFSLSLSIFLRSVVASLDVCAAEAFFLFRSARAEATQEPVFPFSVHRHSTQRPRLSFRFQVLVSAADDAFGDFVSRRIMLPLKDFSFSYLTKECDSLISMSDFLIGQEISQPWSCHP
jgi:hypothetical protein